MNKSCLVTLDEKLKLHLRLVLELLFRKARRSVASVGHVGRSRRAAASASSAASVESVHFRKIKARLKSTQNFSHPSEVDKGEQWAMHPDE